MQIQKVNINDIKFSPIALRTHNEDDDHIIELANEIENRGLLNLPTIVPDVNEEGKYIVTDGARRMTALKRLLKEGKVPEEMSFQVRDSQDELATLSDMVAGNAHVQKTANKDYINALYRLCTAKEGAMSVEELSKKIGKSEEYIWKLFKTLSLGNDILKKAEEKQVPISNLITMSELSRKVDTEQLEEWLDIAAESTVKDFAKQVNGALKEIAEAKKKGGQVERKFVLTDKFIGKDNLVVLKAAVQNEYDQNPSEYNAGRNDMIKEIFQVDEKSAAEREAKWEADEQERKDKAARRKKEREQLKLEESKQKLEEAGFKVTK